MTIACLSNSLHLELTSYTRPSQKSYSLSIALLISDARPCTTVRFRRFRRRILSGSHAFRLQSVFLLVAAIVPARSRATHYKRGGGLGSLLSSLLASCIDLLHLLPTIAKKPHCLSSRAPFTVQVSCDHTIVLLHTFLVVYSPFPRCISIPPTFFSVLFM
ncbi:hypothetical protein F5051DRAFT_423788 [Lentinula edodes]|nr:hypothetical protein F5051DRAFT_423788 [Lentinula edodes]